MYEFTEPLPKGRLRIFACNDGPNTSINVTLTSNVGALTVLRDGTEGWSGNPSQLTRRFYDAELVNIKTGDKITMQSSYMPIIIIERAT